MKRRRFIHSAMVGGTALIVAGAHPLSALAAPSDDELAYANFGQAAELLLQDFYAQAGAAKLVAGAAGRELARGGFSAGEHAAALAKLLTDAGQTAAVAEDFEFAWPDGTFASKKSRGGGRPQDHAPAPRRLPRRCGGVSIASYRTLFASMAANVAQQVAALSQLSGGRMVGISFPPAVDVETASDAIEAYLG